MLSITDQISNLLLAKTITLKSKRKSIIDNMMKPLANSPTLPLYEKKSTNYNPHLNGSELN